MKHGGETVPIKKGVVKIIGIIKDFIFKQKCIPWRVRNCFIEWRENRLRNYSWRLYRLIKFKRLNVNTKKYWNEMWSGEGAFVFPDIYDCISSVFDKSVI